MTTLPPRIREYRHRTTNRGNASQLDSDALWHLLGALTEHAETHPTQRAGIEKMISNALDHAERTLPN